MAFLAGWLAICFIAAIALASRPIWLISIAVAIRILVPYYASGEYLPGLHAAGYLVIATAVVQFILYRPRMYRLLLNSKVEISLFGLLVAIMLVNSLSIYSSILDILINLAIIYLTPFTLYLLFKMEIYRLGERAVKIFSWIFHPVMLYQLWLAIQQNEAGEIIVYAEIAQKTLWALESGEVGRSFGTLDGGLELPTLCVFAVGMTYWVRNSLLRVLLIIAYLYINLLGSGRAALIFGVLVAVAVLLLTRSSVLSKVLSFPIAIIGSLFLYFSEAGQGILEKINDDGGSNQKRFDALTWVSNNFQHFILNGYPGERNLRSSGQLSSSLENAYLMAALDYGLLFSGVLLILQFYIIVKNLRSAAGVVMGLAAVGVIMVNMTNSGFVSNTNGAYLIWVALGLCSVGSWISPQGYLKENQRPQMG